VRCYRNALLTSGGSEVPTLRNLGSALLDGGQYLAAIRLFGKAIEMLPENSAARGDLRAHYADAFLRSGSLEEARIQISRALDELLAGWNSERLPHKAIWLSHLWMVFARVEGASGNTFAALRYAHYAKSVAEDYELPLRRDQVAQLLEDLDGVLAGNAHQSRKT